MCVCIDLVTEIEIYPVPPPELDQAAADLKDGIGIPLTKMFDLKTFFE